MAVGLLAHLHQGIQIGHRLGNQRNLFAPESGLGLGGQLFIFIMEMAAYGRIGRQDSQNGRGQQTLAGTGRTGYRHDLAGTDF